MTLTENLGAALHSALRALAKARRDLRAASSRAAAWQADAERARAAEAAAEKMTERERARLEKVIAETAAERDKAWARVREDKSATDAATEELPKLRRLVNDLTMERDDLRRAVTRREEEIAKLEAASRGGLSR